MIQHALPRPRGGLRKGRKAVGLTYYLEVGENEIEFTIVAHVYPGAKGRTYGPIEKCEPPEPPEIEIQTVLDKVNGHEYTTEEFVALCKAHGSLDCIEALEEMAVKQYCEWIEDCEAGYVDYMMDKRKEERYGHD